MGICCNFISSLHLVPWNWSISSFFWWSFQRISIKRFDPSPFCDEHLKNFDRTTSPIVAMKGSNHTLRKSAFLQRWFWDFPLYLWPFLFREWETLETFSFSLYFPEKIYPSICTSIKSIVVIIIIIILFCAISFLNFNAFWNSKFLGLLHWISDILLISSRISNIQFQVLFSFLSFQFSILRKSWKFILF